MADAERKGQSERMAETQNAYMRFTPNLRQRFWRRLGFGRQWDEELFNWRNQEPEPTDWFVTGAISVHTEIHVSFLDRLRLLLSGSAHIETNVRTDVIVERAESRALFYVKPPGANG